MLRKSKRQKNRCHSKEKIHIALVSLVYLHTTATNKNHPGSVYRLPRHCKCKQKSHLGLLKSPNKAAVKVDASAELLRLSTGGSSR